MPLFIILAFLLVMSQLFVFSTDGSLVDPVRPYEGDSVTGVDMTTLTGKVMCGYQGWFNCEGDGAELGWTHWSRNRSELFRPGNVTVDFRPDISEYNQDELFETGFEFENGEKAKVFSSYSADTVSLHFKWMQDYGIDGAFVQRFAHGLSDPEKRHHKDVVLSHARAVSNQHGRAYAVMYDLSGLPSGGVDSVRMDWKRLREKMHITEDFAYLHHNGKPVVAVWGAGFNGGSKPRNYSLAAR